jgi:hypothetical protein
MATTGTGQGSFGSSGTNRPTTSSPTGSETRDRRAAGEQASGITQTLRDSTYRGIDDQKARASDTLGNIAGAVRGMTQPLRDGGQTQIADYVNQAADGIERWASQLRQQDLEDAVRAVEQFARRQPAMFLGIAFGAGMIAARFLKSSSRHSEDLRRYGRGFDTTPGAGPTAPRTADFGAAQFGTTSGDIPRVSPNTRSAGEVI